MMQMQTAIGDVTQSLEHLLLEHQKPDPWFSVSLSSPADIKIQPSMKPTINLFLLHLAPNPMGQSNSWQPRDVATWQGPPLILHLFYLLTPLAQNVVDGHRALATAMAIFHDHNVLAVDDNLKSGEPDDGLKVELCTFSMEDQTHIWSSLNCPFRTSVFYRIRPVALDSQKHRQLPRAKSIEQHIDPNLRGAR